MFAIGERLAAANPAATIRAALKHTTKGRQPAIIELGGLRAMLAAAETQPAHPTTKFALRLLALTAVRPDCIKGAEWREFEGLDCAEPV